MAEVVAIDRSGHWRRRQRELEEVAVGFRAARPDHNPGLNWRGNRNVPTLRTSSDMDLDLITKLEKSGRVNPNELFTYHTPHHLVHQGQRIDGSNNHIISVVNEMARGRRMLLHLALKEKSKTAEAKKISHQVFAAWPAKIQMLQGEVEGAKARHVQPRYVRIPPLLVTDILLLN